MQHARVIGRENAGTLITGLLAILGVLLFVVGVRVATTAASHWAHIRRSRYLPWRRRPALR